MPLESLYCKDMFEAFHHMLQPPEITPRRISLAYAIAVSTDVLQILLGPFGWAFTDELLDVVAMALTWRLIGFHPLLLPTFILEFLPIADHPPSGTPCVALVAPP